MAHSQLNSEDSLEYFSEINQREEELRKLNQELDLKLAIKNDAADNDMEICDENSAVPVSKLMNSVIESFELDNKNFMESDEDTSLLHSQCKTKDINDDKISTKKSIEKVKTDKKRQKKKVEVSPRSCVPPPIQPPAVSTSNISSASMTPITVSSEEMENSPSIGMQATLRIRNARIKSLESQLQAALQAKQKAEEGLLCSTQKVKSDSSERKKIEKLLLDQKNSNGKLKRDLSKAKTELGEWKDDYHEVKKELHSTQKTLKKIEAEQQARSVRLSRALQECQKFKNNLVKATSDTKENGLESRKEKDDLIKQIKLLERQKGEILSAFKKQSQLIDVLKRQKIHAEASRLISFREEEFMKVLDWGK